MYIALFMIKFLRLFHTHERHFLFALVVDNNVQVLNARDSNFIV